jgi:hypothetical protein
LRNTSEHESLIGLNARNRPTQQRAAGRTEGADAAPFVEIQHCELAQLLLVPSQRLSKLVREGLFRAQGDTARNRLDALRERIPGVSAHFDFDVLDCAVGRANLYAAPGGPDLDGVLAAIRATFDRFDLAAAALTAYDPRVDGSVRSPPPAARSRAESPIGAARRR